MFDRDIISRIWPWRQGRDRARPRLQTRLVLAAFLPTVLILGMVTVLALGVYSRVVESLALERSEALTRLAAQQVALDLRPSIDQLSGLSNSPEMLSAVPGQPMLALRWAMPEIQTFDGGVVVVDAAGHVVAADPRRPELVGQDWTRLDFVAAYMEGREMLAGSSVWPIGPDGGPAIAISIVARTGTGEPQLIAGLYRLDVPPHGSAFYRLLLRHHDVTDRGVYLMDQSGYMVSTEPVTEDLGHTLSLMRQQDATDAGAERMRISAEARAISYARVPDTHWWFVENAPWAALTETGTRYGRVLLGLLALGLVLPGVLVGRRARQLVRPLNDLTRAAHAMAQGDLGQRIEPAEEAELYQLATSFNQMSTELQSLYYGLERQVAHRTHELSMLNRLAMQLGQSLDMGQTLETGVAQCARVVDWPGGLAYRVHPDSGRLRKAASYRVDSADAIDLAPGELVFRDVTWLARPDAPESLMRLMQAADWSCILVVPLVSRAELQGVIILGTLAGREVTGDQTGLLAAMARQIAMAVDNARLYEQAETEAVAAERNRLARELHDSVTQTLFSANLLAGVIPMLWESNPEEAQRRQAELRELTQGALAEMRTLLLELRPRALLDTSLEDLFRQLVSSVVGRARLPVDLELDDLPELPHDVRLVFYRTVQEALNNIVKHAQAEHVWIRVEARHLTDGEGVVLSVRDNGRGFDTDQVPGGHLGLRMMRERADTVGADLQIASQPDGGTTITLCWPGSEGVEMKQDAKKEERKT